MLGLHQNDINPNHIHTQSHSKDAHNNSTQWGQMSHQKSIPSRCLKPRATSLDLAFTTHPCSSTFQVYTHLASITLSAGCYIGAKVPACSRPWNSLFMECRHMFACGHVSASITFFGVGRSDARAVGRSGEAPCSCMISCIASPLSNIDTRAA